jgi:hypothetical protein
MILGRRLSLLALVSLGAACSARAPLGPVASSPPTGAAGSPVVPTPTGAAGAPGAPPSSGGGAGGSGAGGSVEPEQPDASSPPPPVSPPPPTCEGDCATAFDPGQSPGPIDETYAALLGRWQFCSGGHEWLTWAPADTVGVEFGPANGPGDALHSSASGDAYFLVAGPDGAAVRGSGARYHLRYGVVGPPTQVMMMRDDGGFFWGFPRYSACPRQLELQLMYKTIATLHAPLGDADRPQPPTRPACTTTSAVAPAMSAPDFCTIFLDDCQTRPGYTTLDECEKNYAASGPNRRLCQSYHACLADENPGSARALHCDHAAGIALCTQSN